MSTTMEFEGKNAQGEFVVAVRPAVGAEPKDAVADYFSHVVPPLLEGQPIHEPETTCYCLPRLSIVEHPHLTGTVWRVHHQQVVPE